MMSKGAFVFPGKGASFEFKFGRNRTPPILDQNFRSKFRKRELEGTIKSIPSFSLFCARTTNSPDRNCLILVRPSDDSGSSKAKQKRIFSSSSDLERGKAFLKKESYNCCFNRPNRARSRTLWAGEFHYFDLPAAFATALFWFVAKKVGPVDDPPIGGLSSDS